MRPLGRDDQGNVVDIFGKRRAQLAVLETPDADLVAARDRIDAAWDAWAATEREPISHDEAKQLVARHVDEAKSSLLAAGQLCADRDDLISVHARVASVALEVDTLLSDLADPGERGVMASRTIDIRIADTEKVRGIVTRAELAERKVERCKDVLAHLRRTADLWNSSIEHADLCTGAAYADAANQLEKAVLDV